MGYLVLTQRVFLQQVLVTAAHFEDVLALVLLHTHFQLLVGQQHAPSLLPDGLGDHLLGYSVVVDLQGVLLLVVVGGHDHPDHHDDLACGGLKGDRGLNEN